MTDHPRGVWWNLAVLLLNREARWLRQGLWRGVFLVSLAVTLWLQQADAPLRSAPGLRLLAALAGVITLAAIIGGFRAFSSLLADEWTGANFELLQLTGLSAGELLWAKATPQMAWGLSLIAISSPVALFAITLGGVRLPQVVGVYVVALLFFGWCAAWSILASVCLREAKDVTGVALILATIATILAYGVDFLLDRRGVSLRFDLFGMLGAVLETTFGGWSFYGLVASHVAGIGIVTWLALRILRERWDRPRAAVATVETPAIEVTKQPIPVWRPRVTPPRLAPESLHPLMWKDYYFTLGGPDMQIGKWALLLLPLLVLGLLIGLRAWLLARTGRQVYDFASAFVLVGFLSFLGALGSQSYFAARLWQLEIQERTLGQLLMVPWDPREIFRQKLLVLAWTTRPELTMLAMILVVVAVLTGLIGVCIYLMIVLSVVLVTFTDAAWRFTCKRFWDGFPDQVRLASYPVITWTLAAFGSLLIHPLIGVLIIAAAIPLVARRSITLGVELMQRNAVITAD